MKITRMTLGVLVFAGVVLFFAVRYWILGLPPDAQKEPNVVADLFSAEEADTISTFMAKYKKFPGPPDAEVADVGKVLLSAHVPQRRIEKVLGKPDSVSETRDTETGENLIFQAYDIGDSRRMTLCFDDSGNLRSVHGVGVGFDVLTPQSKGPPSENR